MSTARINDRSSLERVYPREAFEQDSRDNARADASVIGGVRILSAPDEAGAFAIARARQQVGEGDPEGDTLFIAPSPPETPAGLKAGGGYGGGEETVAEAAAARSRGGYEDFLDAVLEAARTAKFKRPIGRDDERLRGFRGG